MNEVEPPLPKPDNPYVGPRPFEKHEQRLFFGRDWEAEELVALIIAHPVALLYAESGAGKSSLLNARILPKLQNEEAYEVLPVARVRGDIPEDIRAEQINNLYALNTLLKWTEEAKITPAQLVNLSLAGYLKSLPHQSDREGDLALRIVIFDQFEELFTFYPERWPEREKFLAQVNEALADDSLLRVLFVIREDYLAQLDPYAQLLPEQLRYRFRLERLGREAALAAVTGPLQGTGRSFVPGVAESLVDELLKIRVEDRSGKIIEAPGEFVEPVQLQVVCQSLWNDLAPEVTEISQSQLLASGNVDQALTRFYQRAVQNTVQQTSSGSTLARLSSTYAEWQLRDWFERKLVTPAGTRGLVYRGTKTTEGVPNAAVDLLESHHLIRGEQRAGGRWYELTHDRLIGPIQKANAAWRTATLKKWGLIGGSVVGLVALVLLGLAIVNVIIARNATTREEAATQAAEATAQAAATAQSEAMAAAQGAEAVMAQAAEVQATSTAVAETVRKEWVRPLRPGLSVSGAETVGVGTLGYFVVNEAGQTYILSTVEALGEEQVVQPALFDGGRAPDDVVGASVRTLPQTETMPAVNMVALARLMPTITIQTVIPGIGPVRGVREPQVGMLVRGLGRTTGLTEGQILAIGQNISITTTNGTIQLQNAIRASLVSAGGDGGALVVDDEGYAVGVLIAGSNTGIAILAPIREVLDSFEVELLFPPAFAKSAYLYGLNDRGGESLMLEAGQAKGWVLIAETIGADPNDQSGRDYTDLAYQDFGVIVQLKYAEGPAGTIPLPNQYANFARRAANFVANSSGANIWIVGYEMNAERNRPRPPDSIQAESITPRRYAECYRLVREAIHQVPGHANDQVIVGPIAPWNGETSYEADPEGKYPANKIAGNEIVGASPAYPYYSFFGDFIIYLRDILRAIGPGDVDGIALHAYSHGYDPTLIFNEAKMGPPFEQYHYHFRTYRDQMNVIPLEFRDLPVYLTEAHGGVTPDGTTWPDVNSGWVKNVYEEINTWNQEAGNQPIRAVLLYRWSKADGWHIEDKSGVRDDFSEAVARNYRWRPLEGP